MMLSKFYLTQESKYTMYDFKPKTKEKKMKKVLYSAIIGVIFLMNSAYADTKEQDERYEFCSKLITTKPKVYHAAMDTYSLQNHKRAFCHIITAEEFEKIIHSDMYVFLHTLRSEMYGHDRIQNTCHQLFYDVLVATAWKENVDTIEGLNVIIQKPSPDATSLFNSCGELAKALGKQGV